MTVKNDEQAPQRPSKDSAVGQSRRAALGRLGRFAAVTPPAVALILSAKSKPAAAITSIPTASSRQFKEPVPVPQLRKLA